MPRPGFVLEVDERTPPLIVHEGEGYRMQKFPLGTRVVYPPDPLPGIRDLNAHIRHALLHPMGDPKPLPELLFAGMKLTIAVDDISIPLPPMTLPDIRQRILEQVIELAARKGVTDVEIVVATALHRRMTADEIRLRTQATWDEFYRLPLIWKRSRCVRSLKARLAFVLISKLYRQMYANTGIATDSARVARSARRARVLAKFARRLFIGKPMPDLQVPMRLPKSLMIRS